MTHENPQEKVEVPEKIAEEFTLNISYKKVEDLLASLKKSEGAEHPNKDEIKAILATLEIALKEREIALEKLNGTDMNFTGSGSIDLKLPKIVKTMAKIGEVLEKYGNFEANNSETVAETDLQKSVAKTETSQEESVPEFDFEQHVLKFSNEIIKSMSKDIAKNPTVLEDLKGHLAEAKKEREELLKMILENPEKNHIDNENMFLTEKALREGISKIEDILNTKIEHREEIEVEENESKFILKVSDKDVTGLPKMLEDALKANRVEDFERLMEVLRAAKEERLQMLATLEEKPKSVFRNRDGSTVLATSTPTLLSLITSTLEHYSENQPVKKGPEEGSHESRLLTGLRESYTHAIERIDTYSKELETGTINEEKKADIEKFIRGVRRNMNESADGVKKMFDETHPAFLFIQDRLAELKTLEQKLSTVTVKKNSKKPEEKKNEKPDENYEHTSIKNRIKELSEKLDKESGNNALLAEIKAYVEEFKGKIEQRIVKLNEKKPVDLANPERVSATNDLGRLNSLEEKLNETIKNEEENAKNKMPAVLEGEVATLYASVTKKTGECAEKLKQPVDAKLRVEIEKFITYVQQTFEGLREKVKPFGTKTQQYKNIEDTLKNTKELKKKLANNKEDPKEEDLDKPVVKAEWEGYGTIDIHNPDQPLFIPDEKYEILETDWDLLTRIKKAVEAHNENIVSHKSSEFIRRSLRKVNKLMEEGREYVKGYKPESDEGEIPAPVPAPEAVPAPTSTPDSEARLFTMETGFDYSDIDEDVKFDAWLKNMAEAIERKGMSVESQKQDLDDWHDEYEASIPYEEKLRAIQENIKTTEGKNPITVAMTEKKIADLLFGIHMEGDKARAKIDSLFEKFETVQKQAAEIEKLKQTNEFKDLIDKQRSERGKKTAGLRVEQVKAIMETGGEVNARETIEEMVEFLKDISYNYDFYNNSTEDTHDNMYRLYKKHAASKELHGEKIRWYQKLAPKLFSRMPSNIDQNEFNNFESIIYAIRELDLVDRKTGGKDKAMTNKTKMSKLIRFCEGQEFLLAKHMTDPKSNKEAEFENPEEKELLKTFDKLMKTFADSKYRGKEALERAEEMLSASGATTKQKIEDLTPTTEIFFDDAAEEATLRKEATKSVFRDTLTELDGNINKALKNGIKAEDLSALSARFQETKIGLEAVGDGGSDKLNIDKALLRLDELVIKNLKKDIYKELSGAFPVYDRIIASPDRKAEEKKTYVKELLAALEKHKTNTGNTMIQNAVLSDTIKKYTKILSDIK